MNKEDQTRYRRILFILGLILLLMAILSLFIGPAGFYLPKAIFRYRLTHTMLVIIAGSSLATSGASLQAIFKNPLADPHLFGISAGAALGACLVIAFAPGVLPSIGATLGGFLAFSLLFFWFKRSENILNNCLLAGILINSLASSLITMLKMMLPAHKSQNLLFWLMGHIGAIAFEDLILVIPLWVFSLGLLWWIKGSLEIISFGFDEARLLGIDAKWVLKIAIISNCLLIGNVVSWSGMIGFLGLLTPHLVRMIFSANLRFLIPLATLVGAIILLTFDIISRLSFLVIGTEVPVGALVALVLSPLFFWLLLRNAPHAIND